MCVVCHVMRLYSVVDILVMSGGVVCGTLVCLYLALIIMWSEVLIMSEIN